MRADLSAGRNVAILVEVAARNHLLKLMGVHAARKFATRLSGEGIEAGASADSDLPQFSREDTE